MTFGRIRKELRKAENSALLQGNCKEAPPTGASLGLTGAPLLPLVSNQCLIVLDRQLLATVFGNPLLWVDGLYLRYKRCATAVHTNTKAPSE